MEMKTIQHIFDAHVYKLLDHEFSVPLAEAAEAAEAGQAEGTTLEAAESTNDRSTTSDRPNTHNSSTVEMFVGGKHPAGDKSIECSSSSSRSNGVVEEGASSLPEDKSNKGLHRSSDAVGATPLQQPWHQQQFVGDDVVIPRMRFKWVSEDTGEPSPHVAAMGDGWGGAVRGVRFRLTDVWLSCEQVYLSIRLVFL